MKAAACIVAALILLAAALAFSWRWPRSSLAIAALAGVMADEATR